MSGIRGMKWGGERELYDYNFCTALDKKTVEKLNKFCELRGWSYSKAIRNIIWWHFQGGKNGKPSK